MVKTELQVLKKRAGPALKERSAQSSERLPQQHHVRVSVDRADQDVSIGEAPRIAERQKQRVAGAQTDGHVVLAQAKAGQRRRIVAGERHDSALGIEPEPLHVIVADRAQVGARRHGLAQSGLQSRRTSL